MADARERADSGAVVRADPAGPGAVAGLILAAGAGVRAGGPKALRRDADGTPWLHRAVAALRGGGCDRVVVVLGAAAADARALVPAGVDVTVADDWESGMAASLRVGLAALADPTTPSTPTPVAAVVTLVDLPGLPAAAVARLLASPEPPTAAALRRCTFAGRPGHPVLLGRDHWGPIAAAVSGDRGAADYLSAGGAISVEAVDLWDGMDVDRGP